MVLPSGLIPGAVGSDAVRPVGDGVVDAPAWEEQIGSRAHALAEAAATIATRAKNVGFAVALYETAMADDPEVPGAFDAIEKVLLDAGDFAGAERAYVRQLERLAGRPNAEAGLLDKLARVRETQLGDRRGALQALDRLVSLRPTDVDALARLARLLEDTGDDELALRVLEAAARQAPGRPETFRALARILHRTGDADGTYCACSVLVHLGEADIDEQMTYQQFAPEVAVRPAQPLDDAGWAMLMPLELDGATTALLTALAPAAIGVRIEQLQSRKALPKLAPAEKQDVERTTITAVRTVGWVARLLGMPAPDVYVRSEEVPGGFAVLPTIEPAIALGPSILTGRPVQELAFLFARELFHLRMTGRVLALYPQMTDLKAVVTAAITVVLGPPDSLPPETGQLRRELAKRIDPTLLTQLGAAVSAITERGGQLDLDAWQRAVEIAACRAGLLACGDVNTVAGVLSVDLRGAGGLSAAERLRDLVPFCVSRPYSEVRRALGIAWRPSRAR